MNAFRLLVSALAALASGAALAVEPATPEPPAASDAPYARPLRQAGGDWLLTALASKSALSGGRADWFEAGAELLYRATPELYVGGRVESRTREHETDMLYTALLSHDLTDAFEWHAAVTATSNPHFSVDQAYNLGAEWRFVKPVSALFDYTRFEFPLGSIDQYKPGLVWWFDRHDERNHLTARYAYGRAFGAESYDTTLVRLDLGLPRQARLALTYAHGTDPEKDIGVPGVILTTADTYAAYLTVPIASRAELIVGAEYEDRQDIYTRTTGTVGFSLRF